MGLASMILGERGSGSLQTSLETRMKDLVRLKQIMDINIKRGFAALLRIPVVQKLAIYGKICKICRKLFRID